MQTYDIFFKDLSTGQMLADVIKETSGSFVWGADASTVFYEKMDAAHRPYQLWVHVMGTPQEEDVMLFEETVGHCSVLRSVVAFGRVRGRCGLWE